MCAYMFVLFNHWAQMLLLSLKAQKDSAPKIEQVALYMCVHMLAL